MKDWFFVTMLPWILQGFTPILVAIVKEGMVKIVPKLPKAAVPVFAAALGELVNQLPMWIAGVPGLPVGTAGPIAVFIREVVDQVRKGKPLDQPSR